VLARFARKDRRFDLVVVDPPRAGARGIEDSLSRLVGHTLLMVSCDQVTLARDVSRLVAAGFSLVSAQALDMFPQTHHVEALIELRAPLSLRSRAV
jgi:23S rRNA (uracil1939-C5)-methyltransferase